MLLFSLRASLWLSKKKSFTLLLNALQPITSTYTCSYLSWRVAHGGNRNNFYDECELYGPCLSWIAIVTEIVGFDRFQYLLVSVRLNCCTLKRHSLSESFINKTFDFEKKISSRSYVHGTFLKCVKPTDGTIYTTRKFSFPYTRRNQ